MSILIPFAVALLGAFGFILCKAPTSQDPKELFRITFFVGLLWAVYEVAHVQLQVFTH